MYIYSSAPSHTQTVFAFRQLFKESVHLKHKANMFSHLPLAVQVEHVLLWFG